jgi:hypothetical protein
VKLKPPELLADGELKGENYLHLQQEETADAVITSSALKARIFGVDDIEEKNHFQSVYAHLGHTELDTYDLDRNSSKKFLQYYPQSHQFAALNPRASPPIPSKPPFAMFPTQQIYNGPHISNLHEGNWREPSAG